MTAYLGYDNKIKYADIDPTISDPDYPAENARDWYTYTWWKGDPDPAGVNAFYIFNFEELTSFDYFGIAAHNIPGIVETITLQWFDDDPAEDRWRQWGDVIYPDPAAPNIPIFQYHPESKPYESLTWRLRFASIGETGSYDRALIGVISAGDILALPEGIRAPFVPPPVAYDNKVINSVSQTGQFLGRSIERYGEKMTIVQDQVDPAWMRANWPAMADAIETQPFFYCWNYEQYPEDTVYAWLDSQLTPPHYTNSIHTAFSLSCKCLHRIRWF